MAGCLSLPKWSITLVAWAVMVPLVSAQALSDPTRPAVDDKAAAMVENGSSSVTASVGLQTIIRRKGAKPAAIINGEYVELGGRVGESRVSTIGEDFVVLSGAGGRETLTLTPGIEKMQVKPKVTKRLHKAVKKPEVPARKE